MDTSDTKRTTPKLESKRRTKNLLDFIRASFRLQRAIPLAFVFIFSLSTAISLFSSSDTYASPAPDTSIEVCKTEGGTWESDNSSGWCSLKPSERTPYDRAKAYAVTNAFRYCVVNSNAKLPDGNAAVNQGHTRISEDHLNSGQWFQTNDTWNGSDGNPWKVSPSFLVSNVGDQGQVLCNDLVKEVADLTGYGTKYKQMFCDVVGVRADGSGCVDGFGEYSGDSKEKGRLYEYEAEFYSMIKRKAFRAEQPPLGNDALYVMYLNAFTHNKGCFARATTSPGTNQDRIYKDISILNAEKTGFDKKTFIGENRSANRWVYTNENAVQHEQQCSYIADRINEYSGAYLAWVKSNPDKPINEPSTQTGGTQPGLGEGKPEKGCDIGSLGWIICPAMSFLGDVTDKIYTIVIGLLETKISIFETLDPTKNSTYVAWGVMRNIANIAFVIVFLIIIYSQLTSMGVSNYGIKKMLPKLIVAAILVNLSFYICQIAVDLSNILGGSIKAFFDGIGGLTASKAPGGQDMSGNAGGVAVLVTLAIAGGIVMIATLLPILAVGVVAILMIFLLLLFRQAAIIILIFVAPLAFVAFLLPNTQKFFDQWRKMFTTMLMLYPIIALVFGAAGLASTVIKQSAASGATQSDLDLLAIVALGVALIPLFVVPTLLKGALSSFGAIGAKINSIGSKAEGSARGRAQKAYDNSMIAGIKAQRGSRRADRRARIRAGNFQGHAADPRTWLSRANSSLNNSGAFNAATGGYGAQRSLEAQTQNRKDAQEAISMFNNDEDLMKAWAATGGDVSKASAWRNSKGEALSQTQTDQFKRMRSAGHHQKATSFTAVADYMSQNGKGDLSTLQNALSSAKANGASDTELSSSIEAARAAYRKSGRGDVLGAMKAHEDANSGNLLGSAAPGFVDRHTAMAEAWNEVGADSVHREALSSPEGMNSYKSHLASDSENTRKALAGFDHMEARAQDKAKAELISAADTHARSAGAGPISSIQEAKVFFGIK